MNRDLALKESRSWELGPLVGQAELQTAGAHGNAPFDAARLLQILRDWKGLIAAITALGVVLGILATLLMTPVYRAKVTLEVNPPRVEIMKEQQEAAQEVGAWDFIATQVGLLESRSLAERVVEDLNLANEPSLVDQSLSPAQRLKAATDIVVGNIKVYPPAEGQLIQFDYSSESPELAAKIANAYADAFINSSLQRRYEASAYARNFLQRQIANTRTALERSERQLVAYAQAEGIINTGDGSASRGGDGSSLQGQSLVSLNQALAEATARRMAAEGAYRHSLASGPTSDVTNSTQALRQSRAALEAEYQEKRTSMKPQHPEMVSLQSRIQELDRQIARETSSVASSRSNTFLAEYRAALAAERALQARVSSLKGAVLDLRGRSIRYAILQREVDTNRALYDALLQRYKEIGVAGGVGSAPVSIVDPAIVPVAPYKPNPIMNVLLGLALGLIVGILAAIALDVLNDTIVTRSDVRNKLRLACLGAIPKRLRKTSLLDELDDPASPTSEAYSSLATSLRFTTEEGVPKALLVTSARASEGKSSTIFALAHNFARLGSKVLLVDGDLRKPSFRTANEDRGLSRLLTSDEPLEAHISPTQFDNLSLLSCGPVPPNPADLLSTGRFEAILREAAARFDIVLIDGPPVLGLADSPLLASVCTNVLLIIESGKTRTSAALEAIARMRAVDAHLLGAALTKAVEERSRYGYSYGHYKYGSIDKSKSEIVLLPRQSGT